MHNEQEAPPLTVEGRLDLVSYGPQPGYLPSDFALEFVNFIKLVNGAGGEEHQTPLLHYHMLDKVTAEDRFIANMVFRGAAKTSLFGEYLFLYLGTYGRLPGFGKVDLALYVSDSIENGVKNMRKNLEFRWEESKFLQEYVPEIHFTDIRWEFRNADGNTFIVKGYGAKTGVRGSKEKGKRPDLAVLDDLLSDDDARSPTVIASVEDTIYKAIDYALHPIRSKIIWSGTPFNARDPLYKAIESGAWAASVFPVCEKFPCTKAEYRSAWGDRFPFEVVNDKYQKALKLGKVDTFYQEMMLRIMSDDDRLVDDSELQWYSRTHLLRNRRAFNFYVTTDFAVSEEQKADFSCILVWALNHANMWFLVDGILKRQLMDKNIDAVFRFVQKYRPISVGVEISGQQKGFIPWLQKEMLLRNCYFSFAKDKDSSVLGLRPASNKLVRFQSAVPLFKSQRIFFPEELRHTELLREAMLEIRQATPGGLRSKNDDVLDNISQLPLLNAFAPSQPMDFNLDDNGLWEPDVEDEIIPGINSYIV